MITQTAPAEAPEEIPSTYGSANGFLVSACISTPHRDRPAPTINAMITRGKRMFQMIFSVFCSQVTTNSSFPDARFSTIFTISSGDTWMAPCVTDMVVTRAIRNSTSRSAPTNRAVSSLLFFFIVFSMFFRIYLDTAALR